MSITKQSSPILVETVGLDQNARGGDITTLSDGRFVIVWHEVLSSPVDGVADVDGAVFARIYNPDKSAASEIIQVNAFWPGVQANPRVVATADGGFSVAYDSTLIWGQGTADVDTFVTHFSSQGLPVALDYGAGVVSQLDIAPDLPGTTERSDSIDAMGNGMVAIIANSYLGTEGPAVRIYGSDLQLANVLTGEELRGFQVVTSVTSLAGGNVLIAGSTSTGTVLMRLSGADLRDGPAGIPGVPSAFLFGTFQNGLAVETRVTAAIPGLFAPVDPEGSPYGGFLVTAFVPNGNTSSRLVLQGYTAWGTILDTTTITTAISLNAGKPDYDVIALKDGTFVVAWVTAGANGRDVLVGHFDAGGTQLGTNIIVQGGQPLGDQIDPQLTLMNNGSVLVTFTDLGVNPIHGIDGSLHTVQLDIASGSSGLQPTVGGDVINGTGTHDAISGLSGNDRIDGRAGNDAIFGGQGNDSLLGNTGNDMLNGSSGNDIMLGGDGNDGLTGGDGIDTLRGDAGRDALRGASGNDQLFGGDGADRLDGGVGNDILRGDAGADVFIIRSGGGQDSVADFAGDDFLRLDQSLWASRGALTEAQVLATFRQVVANNTILTFDNGEQITLQGFNTLGVSDLQLI